MVWRHVHGEYAYDAARDGYRVFVDGSAWHFIDRASFAGELVAIGGIPRQSDRLSQALLKIAQGDNMARKEIKIEIVADLENDQFDAVLEAARDAARTVLTMAMVVTTKNKKPTVKVVSSDFMSGEREWTIDTEEVT